MVSEGKASQSMVLACHCCFGKEPTALGCLYGARGAERQCRFCSTARGHGSSDSPAQGPPRHPWPCTTAHPCSQCNSSAWHKLCCEPVLVGPSCPLSQFLHFYWEYRHLGEEHQGEGSLLSIKAHPVAKGHCSLQACAG